MPEDIITLTQQVAETRRLQRRTERLTEAATIGLGGGRLIGAAGGILILQNHMISPVYKEFAHQDRVGLGVIAAGAAVGVGGAILRHCISPQSEKPDA